MRNMCWMLLLILTLIISFNVRSILPSSSQAQTLKPGQDYVQGEVIITFKEEYMPSASDVSLRPPSVGLPQLDDLLNYHRNGRLDKMVQSYNKYSSSSGRFLERTFRYRYDDNIDALDMVNEFSQLPYFEKVRVNRIFCVDFHSTKRFVPGDATEFHEQWYLDNESPGDQIDIDMPEAWAIERGDPSLVIGIFDTGTMIDTMTSEPGWKLHSDFNYYWIYGEDLGSQGVLNRADLDSTDANDDTYIDNIIGTRLWCGCISCSDPGGYNKEFWHGAPHDWSAHFPESPPGVPPAPPPPDCPDSWDLDEYNPYDPHGVQVASIAAGKLDGEKFGGYKDIVGVAHNCKVYFMRFDVPQTSFDNAQAIEFMASIAKVINISFGSNIPNDDILTAIQHATGEELDCVIVASSGNNNPAVNYPAKYQEVIAIGATRQDGYLADYSNYDPDLETVDLVAPVHSGIWADSHDDECRPNLSPCTITETCGQTGLGTSFAAPQVTGVVALVRSRFPEMRQDQVRSRIEKSAQWYWGYPMHPDSIKKYGHGKVNAYRALTEWGEIQENTTWDPSYVRDGCYYISGDLTIKPGVSLTINKGTVIKIAPDHEQAGDDPDRVQIIVQGNLREGTGSGDIVFESFTDSPATKSDWVGIKIESSSQNSLIQGFVIRNAQTGIENHTSLTISNCSIEDCEIGIENWSNIFVQDSDIQHCEDYGILVRSGGVAVDGSSISYSGLHGLGLNPYSSTDAIIASCNESALNYNYGYGVWAFAGGLPPGLSIDVTMSKDTLKYNYAGAGLFDNGCLATIDSCIFGSNNYGIYVYDTSDPVIKRSTIAYDTTSGIRCSIGSNITIEQNNINHTYIGIDAYGSSNPSIKNGNTIQYNTYGIECDDSDPAIEQNTIHENSIGIYAYRFSNPGIKNGNSIRYNTYGIECDLCSHPIVQENIIRYNAIGVLTVEGSCPILGTESGSPSRGHNSIFQNVAFHVSNQSGLLYEISADSNYWGPTGLKPNKFEGNVDYIPFLSSDPNPVSIALPGEDEPGNEKPGEVLPIQFSLSSSYPNPFNPITTIEYQVPSPGSLTTITIFNVRGQKVRTLMNDRKSPGFYSVVWDGRAESGEEVGSGIYFVMMKADGFKATKKLALLK